MADIVNAELVEAAERLAKGSAAARQWVREVPLADVVKDYAVRLIMGTHAQPEKNGGESLTQRYVLYGSSPRGLQSVILEIGRAHV